MRGRDTYNFNNCKHIACSEVNSIYIYIYIDKRRFTTLRVQQKKQEGANESPNSWGSKEDRSNMREDYRHL